MDHSYGVSFQSSSVSKQADFIRGYGLPIRCFQDFVIAIDPSAFVTSWRTTSTAETITIPLAGSAYNFTVNW